MSLAHQGDPHLWKEDDKVKQTKLNTCFDLRGIVIHYGTGMTFGHYWALAKSSGKHNPKWIEYDDTKIRVIDDNDVHLYYGIPHGAVNQENWHCAYMLLYQSRDLEELLE